MVKDGKGMKDKIIIKGIFQFVLTGIVTATLIVGAALICSNVEAAKSNSIGEIDGFQPADNATRMSAGWYDMRLVVVSSITSDTIKMDSLFGTGTICRQFVNRTASDGRINMMTDKGSYFIAVPVSSGQPTVILPQVTKVLKSGTTIDTLIFFLQKRNYF
jgi:hypothetical protein